MKKSGTPDLAINQLFNTDAVPDLKKIEFNVFGKIVQWQRVKSRYDPIHKRIISNNNPIMEQYQNRIVLSYSNACGGVPIYFGDRVPIHVDVVAYFQLPQSAPKKIRRLIESGAKVRRMRTPDDDNVVKNVNDALNKIAFADDKQCSISATSYWTTDTEKLEVSIFQEDYQAW